MFEPDTAARIEAMLTNPDHEPLLKEGSAYSDIYTGGAAEPHFCSSSMGWGPALRAANPLVLLIFLLSNLYSCLRMAVLFFIELGLAWVDFVRGLVRGHDFVKELLFIPARVIISILLRELCMIGGKIDIVRGMPIIHINFLGYDEQSHRRGPDSRFAHWTLKGIDNAIARLWRTAHHSTWRNYEVWVYSDHGQARVRPYHQVQGYTLGEAVTSAFEKVLANPVRIHSKGVSSIQAHRVRFLGGHSIQRLFSKRSLHNEETDTQQTMVTASGPVSHVYAPRPLTHGERDSVTHELVHRHKVPLVLSVVTPGILCGRTEAGEFRLPQDCAELFGSQHPFLDEISADLLRLCEHLDAGDLVLLGWCAGKKPISFAEENGAHAGATPEETHGFALLPADTPLPKRESVYLRPTHLHNAAFHHLGRAMHPPFEAQTRTAPTQTDTLRVMTYNVHSCMGMDGKLDAERIARVIARARPDVVALQELDVGRTRSHGMDQAQQIAQCLGMEFQFHPAVHLEGERYGDAILTHLPHRLVKTGPLPGLAGKPYIEPRGALWIAVDVHGREIQIINTHLGLNRRERKVQVDTLLSSDWLAHAQCHEPVILCGDFNALPASLVCRRLSGRLKDVQVEARNHRPRSTFSGRVPAMRIDHIFISSGLEVTGIEVPGSELDRLASDHLPLVAEVVLQKSQGKAGCDSCEILK